MSKLYLKDAEDMARNSQAHLPPGGRRVGDVVSESRVFREDGVQLDPLARSTSNKKLFKAHASQPTTKKTKKGPGKAAPGRTDFGTADRASGDPASFLAAASLDPLADALARGAAEREGLVAKADGLLSADQAGGVLGGISRQAIDERRRRRRLLAVKVAGEWRYPAAQFGSDGEVVAGLPDILTELSDLGPWAVLDFLLAKDTTLNGASPLEALRQTGARVEDVKRVARGLKTDAFG